MRLSVLQINLHVDVLEFEVHLANIGRILGSSGSLQQAGGDGWWVFLDDFPEAGGELRGSWIRSLAFFPQCQAELLGRPTGRKSGSVSLQSCYSQYVSFLNTSSFNIYIR